MLPPRATPLPNRYRVTLACAALSLGCGNALVTGGAAEPSNPPGLLGKPAPDFRIVSIIGPREVVTLSSLHGQVVLLDFWGTYCAPCQASFPKLAGLSQKYGPQGLRVIGLNEDEAEDRDKIAPFAAKYGAKFTIGWDANQSVAQRYQPETMPSTFVIDRSGIVRYSHAGYRDGDEVTIENEVRALLGP